MKTISLFITVALALSLASCKNEATKSGAHKGDGTVVMYVTRHGKTMFNTSNRMQGWSDTPLTEAGVKIAEDLGKGLKDSLFVAAYSSTSGRAIETADIVMNANKYKSQTPRYQDKDLREWGFGSFEGERGEKAFGDIMKANNIKDPKEMMTSLENWANCVAKADTSKMAEDWAQVSTRIKNSIDKIAQETAAKGGGNVLIVCHGLVIGTIVELLDSSKSEMKQLANASVTKITYKDGKYEVHSVGDMSYVEQGQKEALQK